MTTNRKNFAWLFNELKRRKVFTVVAMYAPAAFILLEVVDIITPALSLPAWTVTIAVIIVAAGFPVTIILAWIFDLTPEGIKKTGNIESAPDEPAGSIGGRRKIKGSDLVITALVIVVGILAYPKIFSRDRFENARDADGKVTIAVLPFENLTSDTLYNIWQGGFQNLLITTLSNSSELSVRRYQAVNEVLNNKKDINIASLAPSFINVVAEKLEAKTMILGNILKAGNMIRINAQLVDTETEEIYKTFQVDGDSENDLFELADKLSSMIKNHIEIRNISDNYNSPEIHGNYMTSSSEAFKYFIRGWNSFKYMELESSMNWFKEAIGADSSFTNAYVYLSYSSLMAGYDGQARQWSELAYQKREGLPLEERLVLDQLNAYYNETPNEEIKYLNQLIELDDMNPLYYHHLGFAYYKLFEYEDAINSWEQIFRIHEKWGTDYMNPYVYFLLGDAYHKINEHMREEEVLSLGHRVFPNAILIQQHQAICAFSQGDKEKANEIIAEYKTIRQNVLHCTEAMISTGLGVIYSNAGMMDEAEDFYRQSISLEPDNLIWTRDFAWFLIDNDINIEEGIQLSDYILDSFPDYWPSLDAKGWGLYKQGRYEEALKLLKDSWDLKPAYSHTGYLHIKEVEQMLASQ
ncbi:MAG: tetratricopeptide repeat protein [Bacteroidia bacterium]|nr:MAG: tetratricopeptide repeat protein [Bacteroidia bacterium]